jgi:ribosomal protein S18 acetylase RimI-like enzyme
MRMIARNEKLFKTIKDITQASFVGVECPPEDTLRHQLEHGELFVYEESGDILAYVLVVTNPLDPYIWSVATVRRYRGNGFATELLNEAIEWYRIKGDKKIELTVNTDNPAQKLYFDLGFRVKQVMGRYYGLQDGLRMRRTL